MERRRNDSPIEFSANLPLQVHNRRGDPMAVIHAWFRVIDLVRQPPVLAPRQPRQPATRADSAAPRRSASSSAPA